MDVSTSSPSSESVQEGSGGDSVQAQLFRLFDLPQELQDAIVSHAYPQVSGLSVVFKDDWDKEEMTRKKRNRAAYVARTFPPLKVNEWLVSKRFFIAAASAWFSAQTFTSPTTLRTRQTLSCSFLFEANGLYCTFGTQIMVPLLQETGDLLVKRLLFCQNLKTIVLAVEESFLDLGERYGWEDELTDDELEGVLRKTGLAALRGVKVLRLRLIFGDSHVWDYISTARHRETFKENLRRVEILATRSACRLREGSNAECLEGSTMRTLLELYESGLEFSHHPGPLRPLYLGSSVLPVSKKQLEWLREQEREKLAALKVELAQGREKQAALEVVLARAVVLRRWCRIIACVAAMTIVVAVGIL